LAGFYQKFVRHFAILAKPLMQLLKKHQLFVWTNDHQKAFEALQQALCSAPVLAIEMDACQHGVGVVFATGGSSTSLCQQASWTQDVGIVHLRKRILGHTHCNRTLAVLSPIS
jgi:hypothetical protein